MPALTNPDLASEVPWIPADGNLWSVVGPLIFGTVLAAIVSLVIAVPVAVGVALFISHYAPRRMASALGYVVDLLAAIPSVVYGLWGVLVLAPKVQPVWQFLVDYFGWIPLFAGDANGNASNPPRVLMTTAIVLAVMILPIITAVSREVFLQTPRLHEEAALALGATRWELVRMAVLPFGRSGVTSAAMLGLGRALGETMAVLMILSPGLLYSFKLLVASQQQTIAGEHRRAVQRRQRHRPLDADRDRSGAVRHHAARQPGCPRDHRAPQGILGSELTWPPTPSPPRPRRCAPP